MKIGIHANQFDSRGTGKVPFDYGVALSEFLGHEPIFITSLGEKNESLNKIKNRFKCILYDGDAKMALNKIVDSQKLDFLYMVKSGDNDWKTPDNCKTGIHCVFTMNEPHGNVYAGVSDYIARKYNQTLYVPHMVHNMNPTNNLRKQLGIPNDAIVIGRLGGADTFNIGFVYNAIRKVLENRKDIYFLFQSTNVFYTHERIIYLPWVESELDKFNFIHSCDGMLHARIDGETFGLAIAEFSIANKPVITWSGNGYDGYDKCHLEILKDKCLKYNNEIDLINILLSFNHELQFKNWDAYSSDYNPKIVIEKFNSVFL